MANAYDSSHYWCPRQNKYCFIDRMVINGIYVSLTFLSVIFIRNHFCKRRAFMTTISELKDIPIAAPQGGIKPAAANGTAIRL